MNKEDFFDQMMDHCLSNVRSEHPPLSEIAACKHYTSLLCEKFWNDFSPAIIIKYMTMQSLIKKQESGSKI